MEFESSDKRKTPPQQHVCVIYDPRDGRIVHGHIFVGGGTGMFGPKGQDERERETLDGARRNHGDVSKFKTLHVPSSFRFAPNAKYRVDVKSGGLVEHLTMPVGKRHAASKAPGRTTRAVKRKS
jgi:hypothetical protein